MISHLFDSITNYEIFAWYWRSTLSKIRREILFFKDIKLVHCKRFLWFLWYFVKYFFPWRLLWFLKWPNIKEILVTCDKCWPWRFENVPLLPASKRGYDRCTLIRLKATVVLQTDALARLMFVITFWTLDTGQLLVSHSVS